MAATKSTDPRLAFAVFNEIGIINQLITADMTRLLGGELGMSEFGVLNHFVRVGDGTTPSRLAKAFQVTKPSMTATIGKLEAKGLVEVVPSAEDRRQKIVRITPAGRKARERAVAATGPRGARLLSEFGAERLEALLPLLRELRTYLDADRNERDGL